MQLTYDSSVKTLYFTNSTYKRTRDLPIPVTCVVGPRKKFIRTFTLKLKGLIVTYLHEKSARN